MALKQLNEADVVKVQNYLMSKRNSMPNLEYIEFLMLNGFVMPPKTEEEVVAEIRSSADLTNAAIVVAAKRLGVSVQDLANEASAHIAEKKAQAEAAQAAEVRATTEEAG